ncbi:ESX secretion-associated protein EspG [Actinokineospora sp. NBRC 105648]|uniref:ESX secretion-associated protein EspG n=1 Tax=Actinokineospora sp. NBRC 105648 TaxID=3032206 RepID=UPI0024A216C3|nr:ESX secretion-associated protein EspG [Actinokineospora sp. NBRC 105648]GLZ38386.1 ESX secretion-associated protein EspG [Actinokineospora sp. NBRC 105648]
MPPRSFSLSLAAVDTLAQVLRVNVRLFPFEVPSFGQFEEDRDRIARAVFTDLTNRGLIHRNQIAPDVEAALGVCADHDVAVAAMGTVDKDRPIRARAAAAGNTGVLAVQEGQSIRFELISPSGLARALVDLLPRAGAGPGQSVLVTEPAPRPEQSGGFVQQVRAPRSTSDTQLRLAATMLERPRTGYGFFAVTGRGRHGREVEVGSVGWIDTDAGRYLSVSRPQPDGALRATYSPADSGRLTQQLGELVTSAVPRR